MFELSVIIAEAPGQTDIERTLASVERACAGRPTEVIVVRPAGRPAVRNSASVHLRECACDEALLVPERWGIGVRSARAPAFACLTTEFVVLPRWAEVLLGALAGGAIGAAGAIELEADASLAAAATYLIRYSPYLPGSGNVRPNASNIPGDTAAYQTAAVTAFPDLLVKGFWEVDFHRRFHEAGGRLEWLPEAVAIFSTECSFYTTLLLRYRHAREFGVGRVMQQGHSRWRLIVMAPLVPLVMTFRVVRRVWQVPARRSLAIRALPSLLAIGVAWAAGEAAGAWSVQGRS